MAVELKGWKDLPLGGVVPGGAARNLNKTGSWRAQRPIWHEDKCIQCLQCWLHCPDDSILVHRGGMTGIDYGYCKGCGLCAAICPKDALEMVPEREGTCAK